MVQRTTLKLKMYSDVMFSDECTVQLGQHTRICFCRKQQLRGFKQRAKSTKSRSISGVASLTKGATSPVMFRGIINVEHLGAVYEANPIPFVRERFPDKA